MVVVSWRDLVLLAAAVLVLATVGQLGGRPGSLAVGAPIYRGNPERREVALACNVVWGTPYVAPMLEVLRRHGAKITFFLGGEWAASHPDLARRMVADGMELGNHGYGHRHLLGLSLAANEEEIRRAEQAILHATGVRTTLYAPAYGEWSPVVQQAADRLGYRVVMWTIDTVDWRPRHTPEVIVHRVLSRLVPGAIILIHPTDRTLAALPRLLAEIRARGYRVVPVGALLAGASRHRSPSGAA